MLGVALDLANELGDVAGRFVDWHKRAGLLNVTIVLAAVTIFALQLLRPVSRPAGLRSYATSAGWQLFTGVMVATVYAAHYTSLSYLFRGPLSFATFDAGRSWPVVVRVGIWLVIIDALSWWTHRLVHRSPVLWRFHSIHHSADHMSYWVLGRSHPVDGLFTRSITLLPILMAKEAMLVAGSVVLIQLVHEQLQHSNLRVGFGRVDYLLTTPQWHRLHHSIKPEHHNRNFGGTFTIWDRVFGTAHVPGPNEFPDVGLDPATFPPDAERLRDVPRTIARQFMFPFRPHAAALRPAPAGAAAQRVETSGYATDPR